MTIILNREKFCSIWNNDKFDVEKKRLYKRRNKRNEQISFSVATINIEISLRKKSILKIEICKMKFFSTNLIEFRVTWYISKFKSISTLLTYVNSFMRKKFANVKQKTTCKLISFFVEISMFRNKTKKIFFVMNFRFFFSISFCKRLMSFNNFFNIKSLNIVSWFMYVISMWKNFKSFKYFLIVLYCKRRCFKWFIHSQIWKNVAKKKNLKSLIAQKFL